MFKVSINEVWFNWSEGRKCSLWRFILGVLPTPRKMSTAYLYYYYIIVIIETETKWALKVKNVITAWSFFFSKVTLYIICFAKLLAIWSQYSHYDT